MNPNSSPIGPDAGILGRINAATGGSPVQQAAQAPAPNPQNVTQESPLVGIAQAMDQGINNSDFLKPNATMTLKGQQIPINTTAGTDIAGGISEGMAPVAQKLEGEAAGATSGLVNKVGGGLKTLAQNFMQKNLTHADDPAALAKYMIDHGISNPKDITKITSELAAPASSPDAINPGIYTNALQSALKNQTEQGRQINLTNLVNQVGELLRGTPDNPSASMITGPQAARQEEMIMNIFKSGGLDPVYNTGGKNVGTGQNITAPDQAYKIYQGLRDTANDLGRPTPGSPTHGLQQTLNLLKNGVKETIFGSDGTSVPLTAGDRANISMNIAKSSIPDATKSALQADVANANSHLDLNSHLSQWINASNAVEQGAKTAAKSGGQTVGGILAPVIGMATAGPLGAAIGAGSTLASTDTGHAAVTGLLSKLGDKLGSVNAGKMLPLLGKIAAVGGAGVAGLAGLKGPGNPPGVTSNLGGAMSPLQQTLQQQQGLQEQLMIEQEKAPYLASSLGGPIAGLGGSIASLTPEVQKQQLLGNAASGLQGAYNNAPTGILGLLSSLIPGTAANAYNQQAATTQAAIEQALGLPKGSGGGLVAQLLQSQDVAQQRQSALQQVIQGMGAPQVQ